MPSSLSKSNTSRRVDLHRRGGQQQQPTGLFAQARPVLRAEQQFQQTIRAELVPVLEILSPRVVRLVDDDKIPVVRSQ